MRLILHPGHGKCGSSSIQNLLYFNRERLFQAGILLPDHNFCCPVDDREAALVAYPPVAYFERYKTNSDALSFARDLEDLVENASSISIHTILVSAENLCLLNPHGRLPINSFEPTFTRLHEILESSFESIDVIYYVRRQEDFIVSAWQQWGHKLGEKFDDHLERSSRTQSPDFLGLAKSLQMIYRSAELSVVPIHAKAFIGGSLLSDFCHRAKLSISELSMPDMNSSLDNRGLNPYICDILRRIPHIYNDWHDSSVKEILNASLSSSPILYQRSSSFPNFEQRQSIRRCFEQDNIVLCDQFFENIGYNQFVGSGPEESPYSDAELANLELEGLKDVVALQMEAILQLLQESKRQRGLHEALTHEIQAPSAPTPSLLRRFYAKLRRTAANLQR